MRIVFMGSPEFAMPSLNALVEAGHEVIAVYSQPPRPAGRGKGERKTAVHERAEELGIEVRTPKSLRSEEEQSRFCELNADLAVVAAYGLILPKPILDAPRLGCVNVHASLLPRWRGAAPIQRAILAGDETSGVTLMQMDEGLDTGPMLMRHTLDIRSKNAGQVTEELAQLGARVLVEWLDHPVPGEQQPIAGATYAKKIDKAEARIDWSKTAAEVERQVLAFRPMPGAWFEVRGERIKLLEAAAVETVRLPRESGGPAPSEEQRDSRLRGNDGLVLDDQLTVATGHGALRSLKLQRAGRAPMSAEELLRGFPIPVGTVLK